MIEVSSGGDQFPELRILADHIGVPWLGEMLSLVMEYTNVFIDIPCGVCFYACRSFGYLMTL
jgi:predicted TIM-barrel fold metal-dependent hydrolase